MVCQYVTPHAGVWIETSDAPTPFIAMPVTPHAGVWIETNTNVPGLQVGQLSRLMQACGLKLCEVLNYAI